MVGYDYVRFLERLPSRLAADREHPDLQFVFPDVVLVFDNFRHRLQIVVNSRPGQAPDRAYADASAVIEEMIARLATPCRARLRSPTERRDVRFKSTMGRTPTRRRS
jgi:anthranilate synthase component 1